MIRLYIEWLVYPVWKKAVAQPEHSGPEVGNNLFFNDISLSDELKFSLNDNFLGKLDPFKFQRAQKILA